MANPANESPLDEALRATPLVRVLTDDQIAELCGVSDILTLAAREVVFREGDAADGVYFVVSGRVEVFKKGGDKAEHVLVTLSAPTIIGELELFTRRARAAGVRASAEGATLVRIRQADFAKRLADQSLAAYKVVAALAEVLAERLEVMDRRMLEIVGPDRHAELAALKSKLLRDWQF